MKDVAVLTHARHSLKFRLPIDHPFGYTVIFNVRFG